MGALDEAFFKPELIKLLREMRASQDIKKSLYRIALQHHNNCSVRREFVKAFNSLLEGVSWSWPRGEKFLISQGEDCEPEDVMGLIHHRLTMAAHNLYRRGQIRAMINSEMGYEIFVMADTDIAPCGYRDGEFLLPTSDVLTKLPLCENLGCNCQWVVRPKRKI